LAGFYWQLLLLVHRFYSCIEGQAMTEPAWQIIAIVWIAVWALLIIAPIVTASYLLIKMVAADVRALKDEP
jgi:hypothetical protein